MVLRSATLIFLSIVVLAGCGSNLKSRDKVQAAIVQRLQKSSGLDLTNLDVSTTALSFDKNLAYATVSFHPKNDPSITNGMTMKYTLEERQGNWVVIKVADSQGHGLGAEHGAAGATPLPPGHPPVDGAAPGGSAK